MEEGLPNVAVEASACGRPVFGSSLEGIAEVVIQGSTGLVLPLGDVRSWAEALVAYSKRPADLRKMGEAARVFMERAFDRNSYAKETLDLYRSVMRQPLGGTG
jgi:glycosyltransferase involved in cell wall biosynthesis